MRVSKLHSIISSVLITAFICSPITVIAQSNILNNFNTNDLTKSDLFTKDFLGGGYAMLDCFGASSSILESIKGFGIDEIQGGSFDAVTVNDRTQNLKTECLDVAAQLNAQKTVASMSKSIFNWSETGNGGDPLYVQDFGKYLKSIDKQEVGILKNEFTTEILNDPKKLPFAKETVKTLQKSEKSKESIVSNLTYTGPDKEEFSKSFKSGGGWNSWLKMTQNPKNNPIGFNLKVSEELQKKQEEAKENVKEELKQTSFLPVRECVDPNFKDDGLALSDEDKKAGKTDICTEWKVTTPGSLVKEQVTSAVTSPLRLAENVDEKGKQLNVMFASLLTQLFNQGFSTLGNRANGAIGNVKISSIVPTYGDNERIDSENNSGDWFDSAWIGGITTKDIPAIIANQKIIIAKLPERADIIRSLIDNTRELDYCVPGPNPMWTKDLGDFIGIKMKEHGQAVPEDFGTQVYNQLNATNLAMVGAAIGSIVPGVGTAIGAAIGFVVGTVLQSFGGPSKEELNAGYAENTIKDSNAYYKHIQENYNNPKKYDVLNIPDNTTLSNMIDNSGSTIKLLQQLFEVKTDSDRQFLNIPSYEVQLNKNTQYISLMKKQMARLQDICVETHKLYVQAFNRQSGERRVWEAWNNGVKTQTFYRINKKDQTGTYIKNTPDESKTKLYTLEEARSLSSVFKANKPTETYDSLNSNITSTLDQNLFDRMFTVITKDIPEPKKVPPLPPFSEYALNCSGNIGNFGNSIDSSFPVSAVNKNIKDLE